MPLFECTECAAVENTALCEYWIQQKQWFEHYNTLDDFAGVCSQCRLGLWHGEFPRQTVQEQKLVKGDDGFLIADPGDAATAVVFRELLDSLEPSERARVIAGCMGGYFSPAAEYAEQLRKLPPPSINPAEKKRRRNGA